MSKELERKLNNIIQIGTVTEVKSAEGLALARVNILGRVTDFLPVFMWANDFVKVWLPIRVGQQVAVLSPFGNANSGIILPSIYNNSCKEPSEANDENIVVEFAGGVIIDSDGKSVNVTAPVNVNVTAATATVTATNTIITSTTTNNGNVTINGNLAVNGNIAMNGADGSSGVAEVTGDLKVSGIIYDSKGDLTNHTHSTTDGATAEAR